MTTTVTKQGKRFKISDIGKSVDAIIGNHKGKDPKAMAQKDKDDLFIAMLKKLGMLDENGKIRAA